MVGPFSAHDDGRSSLSVSLGDDHRLLLCCHAGCETTSIVRAVGCELGDLFPDDQPDWSDDRTGHQRNGHAKATPTDRQPARRR